MLVVVLAAIAIAALTGLAVKKTLEFKGSQSRITWREFAIGMAISPVVAGLVAWAGWSMAKHGKVTFTEYWNGWEVAAVKEYTQCSRDGPCRWEYDCDPYLCSYECGEYEGTGDDRHYVSKTCWKTCYHDCPYVNREYNFSIDTTLGRYSIASNVFPDSPQSNRWRASTSVPQSVISRAGIGEPSFWVAARNRCEANMPGPVTARRDYKNYILASDHTLMKEHSSDIAEYQSRKLLPSLAQTVDTFYRANKLSFIGWQPPNSRVWQEALEYLNANLGHQMQGDLHLVVIKDDAIASNPERYSLALKAYWQNKEVFGDHALSKNAVVVLVGTADEVTVSWSRAFTGMPLGNEKLIVIMRDGLKGMPLNYESLIGPVQSRRDSKGIYYPPDERYGSIQRIIFGLDDQSTKFKRVRMSGDDRESGFLYLKNEIQPSAGQTWVILIVSFLACCGAWVWAANHYDPSEGGYRWRRG